MTAKDFRRIALDLKDVVEGAHMGHPDFRAGGKVFATLHADNEFAMVKLTPEQQASFVRDRGNAFKPENGAWGRQGCTAVDLAFVDEDTLGEALTLARQNLAALEAAKSKGPRRP